MKIQFPFFPNKRKPILGYGNAVKGSEPALFCKPNPISRIGAAASAFAIAGVLVYSIPARGVHAESVIGGSEATNVLADLDTISKQSVSVIRLKDGKELFSHNANQLLAPASVTKVLTSATILAGFSPALSLRTRLYYTGVRKGSQVLGDLVVVGDGDPMLISEKLWQVAADLSHLGIKEIKGNIIIDNSLFGDPPRDAAREAGSKSSSHAYDAEISAFAVNFNTVAVAVAGGAQPGEKPRLNLDPFPISGFSLENRLVPGNGAAAMEVTRISLGTGERIQVSGRGPKNGDIAKIYRSVGNSLEVAGEYLRSFLGDRDIRILGRVRAGLLPESAKLLYEIEGYPMGRLVAGLNTYSNNFIADMLLKRLGAWMPKNGLKNSRGSGTYENGLAAMNEFLAKEVGLGNDFVLHDGSGLNPTNRISAAHITQLLGYMEKRMDLFPEFLASLPASGWDGTLAKRFRFFKNLHGLIRAKTGTLSEPIAVSSLAGYFRHPEHGMVAFAILQNGINGKNQPSAERLRESQDKLVASWLPQASGD